MQLSLMQEAIGLNHDHSFDGHQVTWTWAQEKAKFYWYKMKQDIAQYVYSCPYCNQQKNSDRYSHIHIQEYWASVPMESIHLDFLSLLPLTTRWWTDHQVGGMCGSSISDITAKVYVVNFSPGLGIIFGYQGLNWVETSPPCDALEIHEAWTMPYRPSVTGQTEYFNWTLTDAAWCYIKDSLHHWDIHLSQIADAMRSAVNCSTDFTANKLMLGKEVNAPDYLMFPHQWTVLEANRAVCWLVGLV